MQARIFKPAKNAMQTPAAKNMWILEFLNIKGRTHYIEPILGRIASNDMPSTELRLKFNTKEGAIRFAIKNNYTYDVIEPRENELIKKNYASNFV